MANTKGLKIESRKDNDSEHPKRRKARMQGLSMSLPDHVTTTVAPLFFLHN
jgi:hypothetical protein